MGVYERCPAMISKNFFLRFVQKEDCDDLFRVYSDKKAVPLFNADNCHGDDFDYQTKERMMQAIEFWIFSYKERYFVRWSIIDRRSESTVGTVELFAREALEGSGTTALLRLDLRSDYENPDVLKELLLLLQEPACELFESESITTKAASEAAVRRQVLAKLGYHECRQLLIGDDGTQYGSYYVCTNMHKCMKNA